MGCSDATHDVIATQVWTIDVGESDDEDDRTGGGGGGAQTGVTLAFNELGLAGGDDDCGDSLTVYDGAGVLEVLLPHRALLRTCLRLPTDRRGGGSNEIGGT